MEGLILFEWLSRNWERSQWENEDLFSDPAEKQLLMWLESDLASVLKEPFDLKYHEILSEYYRKIVPDPKEWELSE